MKYFKLLYDVNSKKCFLMDFSKDAITIHDTIYDVIISENEVINYNDEFISNYTNANFIEQYSEYLKKIPCFIKKDNKWLFVIEVEDFCKIKNLVYNNKINKIILDEFPIWKQITLHNDRDMALRIIKLSNKEYSIEEIENIIIKSIPICEFDSFQNIFYFYHSLDKFDISGLIPEFKIFVDDFTKVLKMIIKHYVYYTAIIKAKQVVNNIKNDLQELQSIDEIYSYHMEIK